MMSNWLTRRAAKTAPPQTSHSVGTSASSEVRDAVTGQALSLRTAGKPDATTQMHQTPPRTGGPAGPFGMCVYPGYPPPAKPWYGGAMVIPRTVHDMNDNEFTVSEANGRIRFTHWSGQRPTYIDFDPNTSTTIEHAIAKARAAAHHRFVERYRCKVCGGFDVDAEGNPEVCMGPLRGEPDWEEL